MTETEKMLAGKIYDTGADKLPEKRARAHRLCLQYNNTSESNEFERSRILKELIPNAKNGIYIQGPIYCDYGNNIFLGENCYINFNATILDCAKVTIGDNVFIGPNLSIFTPVHPLRYQERNIMTKEDGTIVQYEYAKPITIGNNCWIAGNVTIIGGVTIGDGSVIGAGSVVTRNIPANSLAVGNPCRVIRKITEKDKVEIK